jgi:hypothetical protein
VTVSPITLSQKRREAVARAYGNGIYECKIIVENEIDMLKAVEDVNKFKTVPFSPLQSDVYSDAVLPDLYLIPYSFIDN